MNVGDKKITKRKATAKAIMFLGTEIISHFRGEELVTKKGPVFQTAIIAGIQAVKKTSELIPMCHPLLINGVDIDIEIIDARFNAYRLNLTAANCGAYSGSYTGLGAYNPAYPAFTYQVNSSQYIITQSLYK